MPHILYEALFRVLTCTNSKHKTVHHRARGCLQVMGLKQEEVVELLYLLVFVYSARIEEWPRQGRRGYPRHPLNETLMIHVFL